MSPSWLAVQGETPNQHNKPLGEGSPEHVGQIRRAKWPFQRTLKLSSKHIQLQGKDILPEADQTERKHHHTERKHHQTGEKYDETQTCYVS